MKNSVSREILLAFVLGGELPEPFLSDYLPRQVGISFKSWTHFFVPECCQSGTRKLWALLRWAESWLSKPAMVFHRHLKPHPELRVRKVFDLRGENFYLGVGGFDFFLFLMRFSCSPLSSVLYDHANQALSREHLVALCLSGLCKSLYKSLWDNVASHIDTYKEFVVIVYINPGIVLLICSRDKATLCTIFFIRGRTGMGCPNFNWKIYKLFWLNENPPLVTDVLDDLLGSPSTSCI